MLAIGRALMARPKMLLLDEPSLGLAPMLAEEVYGRIREINRDGLQVLLVEQTTGPSAAGGDLVSNDYQIVIPDVRSAAYTGTLTYIATATP